MGTSSASSPSPRTNLAAFQLLPSLPKELLLEVLERLERYDLECLQLVSRWGYHIAAPLRWREVKLVDCRTRYEDGVDEHDDTPLIKVLLILARYVPCRVARRCVLSTSQQEILFYRSRHCF